MRSCLIRFFSAVLCVADKSIGATPYCPLLVSVGFAGARVGVLAEDGPGRGSRWVRLGWTRSAARARIRLSNY